MGKSATWPRQARSETHSVCCSLDYVQMHTANKWGVQMNENKLRRQNGIIAGVCGGLGEFFGVSPLWFRMAFLLLMIPGGLPGLLPYIVLWLVIPRR